MNEGCDMEADVIRQARELAAKEGIEFDEALMVLEIEVIKRIERTEGEAREQSILTWHGIISAVGQLLGELKPKHR